MSAETAWYLALLVGGALLSGPIWVSYALKQEKERAEWLARRRERDARQVGGQQHGNRPRAR